MTAPASTLFPLQLLSSVATLLLRVIPLNATMESVEGTSFGLPIHFESDRKCDSLFSIAPMVLPALRHCAQRISICLVSICHRLLIAESGNSRRAIIKLMMALHFDPCVLCESGESVVRLEDVGALSFFLKSSINCPPIFVARRPVRSISLFQLWSLLIFSFRAQQCYAITVEVLDEVALPRFAALTQAARGSFLQSFFEIRP